MADSSTEASSERFSKTLVHDGEKSADVAVVEQAIPSTETDAKSKKLGWKKLTICMIVEAIALGTLAIPDAFKKLGLVLGIFLTIVLGCIAIWTSYLVGQVSLRYPKVQDFADAVRLMFGRPGYWVAAIMYMGFLVLITGSHVLTGTIALNRITNHKEVCALIFGVVSAVLLLVLALPSTFSNFAWLGVLDFASIIIAIIVTVIGVGVTGSQAPDGLAAVDWSWWPDPDVAWTGHFLAATNIAFAYCWVICQPVFMSEMHTPKDYMKAVWTLGGTEIILYLFTGISICVMAGSDVRNPALLVGTPWISRLAFGLALPVIFVSGSINSNVGGHYILNRLFANDPKSKYRLIKGTAGWALWITLLAVITILAWVAAESVPFFSEFLGVVSSIFVSAFSFYFPALFWFCLLKEGKWNHGWKNITLSIINGTIFLMGVTIVGAGTYSSAIGIKDSYAAGTVGRPFSCTQGIGVL